MPVGQPPGSWWGPGRTARLQWGQGPRAGAVEKYLVDVVKVGTFVRPVVVALPDAVLRQGGQHDDDHAATLPHHLRTENGRGVTGSDRLQSRTHRTFTPFSSDASALQLRSQLSIHWPHILHVP